MNFHWFEHHISKSHKKSMPSRFGIFLVILYWLRLNYIWLIHVLAIICLAQIHISKSAYVVDLLTVKHWSLFGHLFCNISILQSKLSHTSDVSPRHTLNVRKFWHVIYTELIYLRTFILVVITQLRSCKTADDINSNELFLSLILLVDNLSGSSHTRTHWTSTDNGVNQLLVIHSKNRSENMNCNRYWRYLQKY